MTWHVGIMATGDEVKAAASAPASGGPRRRWVIVIAMLLAVAAVILWRWPESGPRYRGQGVGAYFPVWHWPSARRTGSLYGFPEDAGADAVPFLIEVTRLPESGLRDWLAGLYWDPLPSSLQRWIPRPTYVEETRQLARTQLRLRLQRPDCLHEMLRRFDDLPPDTGALLLAQAGSLRSHPKEVLPLLRRLLHGTNADRQEAAASAVLDLGDGGRPLLPDLLAYLETLEVPKGNPGPQSYSPGAEFGKWQLWCLGLGALEVAGQSAAPLLEVLKTNDDVNIRAAAGLARARVRGEPGAVRQFLESEVLPAGLPATVAFMRVMWWEHGVGLNPVAHGNAPVDDLLPVWISLLLTNHNTSELAPPAPVPDQATGETVSQQVRGLRLTAMWAIRRYGTNAVPVAPALAGLLQDPDELIREEAADALGGIGPVAPETIPRLVSALADPWLFDLLVTLVGD